MTERKKQNMPESIENHSIAVPGRGAETAADVASSHAGSGAAVRRWALRVVIVLLLALGLGYLPLQVFGEEGLVRYRALGRELAALRERNKKLAAEIRQMRLEVSRLRDDDDTLEQVARQDLGMVRPGEWVFVLEE